MPTIGQGGTLPVRAEVHDGLGALANVSSLVLTIRDSGNSIVAGFPVSLLAAQIVHDSAGKYHYDWVVSVSQPTGTYKASWEGTLDSAPVTGEETLYVTPAGSIVPAQGPLPFRYLTPRRFRAMKFGVDITGKTDYDLEGYLEAAAVVAEGYCQVPRNHDFRGGTVTDEQHRWRTGNAHVPGQRRLYVDHHPIKAAGSVVIEVTNNQSVTFEPSSMYVNYAEDWLEIIALELTVGSVLAVGVLPNLGLKEPVAKANYTYGWDFPVEDERLSYHAATTSGNEFFGLNQFWTDDPVVVKKNGLILSEGSDYTTDHVEGIVKLAGTLTADDLLTASYHHPLPFAIARATGMIAADMIAQDKVASAGLVGLSSLRVEEVEMRVSRTTGFNSQPINPAAAKLLGRFIYRPMA